MTLQDSLFCGLTERLGLRLSALQRSPLDGLIAGVGVQFPAAREFPPSAFDRLRRLDAVKRRHPRREATGTAAGAACRVPLEAQGDMRTPFADQEVRNLVVGRWGEDFARSWIDGAGWDAETRTLIARSVVGYERIRRDLRREFKAAGVSLKPPRAGKSIRPRTPFAGS